MSPRKILKSGTTTIPCFNKVLLVHAYAGATSSFRSWPAPGQDSIRDADRKASCISPFQADQASVQGRDYQARVCHSAFDAFHLTQLAHKHSSPIYSSPGLLRCSILSLLDSLHDLTLYFALLQLLPLAREFLEWAESHIRHHQLDNQCHRSAPTLQIWLECRPLVACCQVNQHH